jgi:hypothetical protein
METHARAADVAVGDAAELLVVLGVERGAKGDERLFVVRENSIDVLVGKAADAALEVGPHVLELVGDEADVLEHGQAALHKRAARGGRNRNTN